jgi:hypothetical protein
MENIMSFNKNDLLKLSEAVKKEGVTSYKGKELRKSASAMRIAYLTAFIKKNN